MWRNRAMPDQATALALVASPSALTEVPGPALDTGAGARVIALDSRRWRPSPEAMAASRASHPAQLWADNRARLATPS